MMRCFAASGAYAVALRHLGGCSTESAPVDGLPWWVSGNYAPVPDEIEAFDLPVEGELPRALAGLYLRNGPNPPTGESPMWFFGAGMAHGVWLEDGQARAYRNRYVRTKFFTDGGADEATPDLTANLSNTAYAHHDGKLLSLYEGGRPYVLSTDDLSTVGSSDFDYGGKLLTPMTAHPRLDPATGELHFIGYGPFAPYLTYHMVDATGALARTEPIDIPNPSMIHDVQLTASRVVFLDLPVLFDLDAAAAGQFPFAWSPQVGARIGVMPRAGGAADVQWFDVDPCYVFHTVNAFDDGDKVIVLAARHDHMWAGGMADQSSEPRLHRWELDVATGAVSESQLDDRLFEFPVIDPRLAGRATRVAYGLQFAKDDDPTRLDAPAGLIEYDTNTGAAERYDFAPHEQPDEHRFVPDPNGSGERDGWLLGYVYDANRDSTDLCITDTRDLAAGPVARVALPRRVPFGFHGHWVPLGA